MSNFFLHQLFVEKENGETRKKKKRRKTDCINSSVLIPMHTDKVLLASGVPGFQITTIYLFNASWNFLASLSHPTAGDIRYKYYILGVIFLELHQVAQHWKNLPNFCFILWNCFKCGSYIIGRYKGNANATSSKNSLASNWEACLILIVGNLYTQKISLPLVSSFTITGSKLLVQ